MTAAAQPVSTNGRSDWGHPSIHPYPLLTLLALFSPDEMSCWDLVPITWRYLPWLDVVSMQYKKKTGLY